MTIESVGIQNHFKLGHWTDVTVKVTAKGSLNGTLLVSARDGDNVPATYNCPETISLSGGESKLFRVRTKIGRATSGIAASIIDADGKVLSRSVKSNSELFAISPLRPLYLAVANSEIQPLISEAIKLAFRGVEKDLQPEVLFIDSVLELPQNADALMSCEVVILPTGKLATFDLQKAECIQDWVRGGGQLLLTCGSNAGELLAENKPLAGIAPGKFTSTRSIFKSPALETFSSARDEKLVNASRNSFKVSTFETSAVSHLNEDGSQIILQHPVGFGQVITLTADIDTAPLSEWKYTGRLLSKVLERLVDRKTEERGEVSKGTVTHIGYSDMCGQLRAALDQFNAVSLVNFTLVAFLSIVYILLIGPGDFFFLRRFLKRMELTWITFPIIALLFGGIAWAIFGQSKSNEILVNQVEVIDVDQESGQARGKMWAHLYSPNSQLVDLQYPNEPAKDFVEVSSNLTWEGLPGNVIGGMSSQGFLSGGGDGYQLKSDIDGNIDINELPIQVASTKSFTAEWSGKFEGQKSTGFTANSNSNLTGQFTNPFDHSLRDCVIMFGPWVYVLKGRLAPGATVSISEMTEKSTDSYLTRRKLVDGRDINTAWNSESKNIPRIMEILMFYNAAGGQGYTGLSQQFNRRSDLSAHLSLRRAIFVGRTKSAVHHISVNGEEASDASYDKKWTFFRVVIPVEIKR